MEQCGVSTLTSFQVADLGPSLEPGHSADEAAMLIT